MSRACQLITHLQLFTRVDTITKEMLLIDEPGHYAVRLQLLEMSSFTTPEQTISKFFFRKNIGDFTNMR